jgi:hypothetical protein
LLQEVNAFTSRFAKKPRAIRASGDETALMVDPCNLRRETEQYLELRTPGGAFKGKQPQLEIPQPIGVKFDVPGFIAQDPITNLFEDGVSGARVEQTIISGPDQLRDHQNLKLEVQSEGAANEPEQRVRPMTFNRLAAETMHQLFE